MKRILAPLLACATVLVVAACGGGHHHGQHHPASTGAAGRAALRCPVEDTTMGCVLATLPPAPRTFGARPARAYGVDFGWQSISAAQAKRLGASFGASYFSTDGSKDWTRALVDSYHRAGLKTVGVWETTATRAQDGYAAGVADARAARTQAAAVGNTNRPLLFAVDCDCTSPSILGYFLGVHRVLGSRDDAYGGYSQLMYLYAHHVVGHENWATYAWSSGRFPPASVAPLEQYLNGALYDNDRAVADPYGQWPWSAPKPKPRNVMHYERYDAAVRDFNGNRASERNTVRTWDRARCMNPVARTVCKTSRYHLILLRGRLLALHAQGRSWGYGSPSSIGARNQQLVHRIYGHHRPFTSWQEGL